MRLLPHPSMFHTELSDDKLCVIAKLLLDVRYRTLKQIGSLEDNYIFYDDNYTRETLIFGRSRNALIQLILSKKYNWLTLTNPHMDLTFNIGSVPCRYFRDDPNKPEKRGFFKRNACDCLFSSDDKVPVMWRFILQRSETEEDESKVFFIGYNLYEDKVSEWEYSSSVTLLSSVDQEIPQSIEIPSTFPTLKELDEGNNKLESIEKYRK